LYTLFPYTTLFRSLTGSAFSHDSQFWVGVTVRYHTEISPEDRTEEHLADFFAAFFQDNMNYRDCVRLNAHMKKIGELQTIGSGQVFDCKCISLAVRVLGDGCDECNPELADELARDVAEIEHEEAHLATACNAA
jgi:hypothetical protein